ncbi:MULTISPECIES: hypothetical protein [Providencia]|uniref:Uncharacterized protein n=1 Tax=Providencia rettgeri TaxID=587 RepID=A0AAJ4NJB8_PRORE|nr:MULTISPECIES: hypothetical protein [Providencia]MBQ0534821.1 hypothetical protein [Providencia huaxiensis]MBQ0587555.1 hypothetical protein [Providencia huaxiensis]PYZ58894.1 hypothetical protein DNK63_07110 [Providencia rettgeri]QWQ16874.1 hypothetical protein KOL65_19460 [Providencia rettgeri]QWQ19390.1 hypothetical protein KOF27_12160 [Providencia rettgeri]
MSDGMIISLVIWVIGMLFFCGAIIWHYKRQPSDRLPIWATSLIIVFWFIALPLALLILFAAWIDDKYFSDEDD